MKECICKLKRRKFNLLFNGKDNFEEFINRLEKFNAFDVIKNSIDFMQNPEYHLEEHEWFKLDLEQLEQNMQEPVKVIFKLFENSADISHIEKSKLNQIKLIMNGEKNDNEWRINCQVIYPSKILKEDKKFLVWSNGIKVFQEENLVMLEDRIDFILDKKTIYFKKLSDLNNIHGNFKHLYKEASHEEVKNIFIDELKYVVVIERSLIKENRITPNNLKKIKFHRENGIFKTIQERPQDFVNYLKKHSLTKDLVKDNKIKIESDKDINILLKACSQQVYNGEFTNESFLASGNRKLEGN